MILTCKNCKHCNKFGEVIEEGQEPCWSCLRARGDYLPNHEMKQTNADRIRSMSDEELAEFFYKHMQCNSCCVDECVTMLNDTTLVLRPCELRILAWLKKEEEE